MSGNPFEDDEDPMLAFGASGQNETPFSNPGAGNMDAMEALASVGPPPQRGSRTPADIASAMAMLADAFLNKGRTIGPLLGQLASRQDPAIDNYKLRMDDAMKRAQIQRMLQGGHADPEQMALRREALRLQESGQQIQRDQMSARSAGISGLRDAMVQVGADPAQLEGLTDAQAKELKALIATKMRQEGSNAAATEREAVRNQHRIDAENRRPGVAAETAAASTRARLDQTNGTPDEMAGNFEAANPKLEVTDQGTFSRVGSNPRTAASRQKELSTATRALDASARLRELEKEYTAIPYAQRLGDDAIALKREYDTLVTEHQGILASIAKNAGTAKEREEMRKGIPSIHDPFAASKLKGIERMLHLNVSANLGPSGVGIRGEGESSGESQQPDLLGGERLPTGGTVEFQLSNGKRARVRSDRVDFFMKKYRQLNPQVVQ
jgi:hypothetical protein